VWNEFKSNLSSASVYLKEFFLFFISFIILTYIIFGKSDYFILFISLSFLFNIILLNYLGKKRLKELNKVKQIIYNIRKNYLSKSEEIKISKNLRSVEEEIQKMFEKMKNDINYLTRLEKMRTEFLANVSHELRTPIFAIQGYVETLLDGAINDKKVNKYFLEKANQHTINLSNLLNDLIDISMIESGEMRMSFRYFNINEYLISLVKELEPMAKEKNLELIFNPVRENLQLLGDKNKLRQVFINLITNAIKYTEQGKVEIFVEEEQKFGKIIIKDTGIGIPEEDIARIFERFYRVDKARSRAVGGTGLGLAIVKHITEAHGSSIEVKSEVGKGSEFSFKLKK
jgi:two-component system, OmpR family, phosphate regulon sensor histidine kinase PhoR